MLDNRGHVCALQLQGEQLEVDFAVDASGLARMGLGSAFRPRLAYIRKCIANGPRNSL
ncbi:tryptophan 7-halogenase [Sinorhizobium alkalisoli]|nr:tryptophan 7-halogenase [Sinorhizobium alkalisoli]